MVRVKIHDVTNPSIKIDYNNKKTLHNFIYYLNTYNNFNYIFNIEKPLLILTI